MSLKKIVVLGPESTGKSTLCNQLATVFNCNWCPEYAREYLTRHGMNYSYADLLTIAQGQLELEEEHIARSQQEGKHLLFIDTDQYVMKVWCEYVFGRCHTWILEQIVKRQYDLYLLCNTDLPWTPDPLREYPDPENREKLFHIYKDIMTNQSTPWVEISGTDEERLSIAVEAVRQLL